MAETMEGRVRRAKELSSKGENEWMEAEAELRKLTIEETTGAKIDFGETGEDIKDPERARSMTMVGTLAACYSAHAMMMGTYCEAEREKTSKGERKGGKGGKGGGGEDVADLKAQIAALQSQLAMSGGGGGGGGSSW